jgi:Leucine-rich repeat (LRR) protein
MNAAQVLAAIQDAAASGQEDLNLSFENIREIPPEIGTCTQLRKLYLTGNKLQTVPQEISLCASLEKLSLDQNQITSLPSGVCDLANLRILHLDGNDLPFLPTNIGDLSNLWSLDLGDGGAGTGNNSISNLPPGARLLSLYSLDCHNCPSLVPEGTADSGMYDPNVVYDYLGIAVPD